MSNDAARTGWWHDAIGYEIYVRSFADSDGDGVGDLAGITERLDHLVDLGIDVIWITPFYRSPMADFGYDVADYTDVDPAFGDVADFERLTTAAHERGIKVVVDIVPNHCSSAHRWFQQALADPDGPYRDYFIWRDPADDGGYPNNWVGYFGGPVWTLDPASGQYYLHMFLPEQPDLNWRNPAVLDEFDAILRTWLERGVDGFRVDVAQALVKDEGLRDNPQLSSFAPDAERWEQWDAFEHRHDVLQPGTRDVFARWKAITAEYDAVLIGETYVLDPAELDQLLDGRGLDVGFWFKPMHIDWDPVQIRATLEELLDGVADPRMIGWVAASHDEVRPPTRFGAGDLGRRRALAFSTLLFGLPGMPFLYQGEELGLLEGVVPEDRRADPVGADVTKSRDGCRTPMPWEPGVSFGFSTNPDPWLPHGGRVDADTAAFQRERTDSWFARYRALVALRHEHADLRSGDVEWIDRPDKEVVSYRRGPLAVVANTADAAARVGVSGEILYSTLGRSGSLVADDDLSGAEAVVLRIAE